MKHLWRVVSTTILMMFAAISGLFFYEKAQAGTPVTGDIIANTIWSPTGSPYWIEKNITVQTGAELTILAGTEVRFNGYYSLWVDGRILVNGNATDPVKFTSNSTTPTPEDWVGLLIVGEAHVNFANVSYSRAGVTIASSHATVNESSFYKNFDSLVLSGGSQNLIRNNTILNSFNLGLLTWYSTGNNVTGNNATGNGYAGIVLVGETNTTVSHNTLYRNSWKGIFIWHESSKNRISNNTVLETRWYEGIGVQDSHDNYILNNTIRRNNNSGIYLEQSSGNTVSGNEISDSFLYHGISLYLSNSSEIAENKIHDVALNGINIESSQGNRIVGNDILSNDASGIYIDNSSSIRLQENSFVLNSDSGIGVSLSDQVAISNNDVVSNVNNGIAIMDSSNVTVLENNVSENGVYGVALFSSTNVSVYHNNLVNNSNQAYDDASIENRWDDGYPSGGNYWDDYTGSDYFSGPDQDQPGSDYIGDEPYVIDSDSQDSYPLVHSFGASPSLAPTNLDAHLSGRDLENITLTWNLSGDDGTGRDDIVEYSLFRGTTYHPSGFGYVLLANVANGTSMFTDAFAGEGDPDSYFYKVCAVNTQGIPSCTVGQGAKFTRPLVQGPNLISIPLSQNNESIETVLQTVEYDNTWYYDSSSREWKWCMKHKEYRRGMWNVSHAMGLWIDVTEDSNLTVAGIVPAQTTIHLHKGWNLVGFPSFNTSYAVADLKVETGATRVEGYDIAPPNFLRALGDGKLLQPGYGYWVQAEAKVDWIVEMS